MNIEHYIRVGRLLAELHGDEVLSEQQCAKIMGVDLVSWRIIEHTFSRGSWGETIDESGPTSEEAILAALPSIADAASSFEFDHCGITHTVSGSAESIKALLAWKAHQEKVTNNALRMVAAK